ncbi:Nop2 protein, NOL1/NOP2/sun family protein, partial [Spraguea lophii 42_110]
IFYLYFFICILFYIIFLIKIFFHRYMLESSYSNFFREKLSELFNKDELDAFLEESEKSRPLVIRCNSRLIKRKELSKLLIGRGMDVDGLEWNDSALIIYKSEVPVGATPEYLAGYYFIQGASSLLPVLSLDVKENLDILDMCASPGGKTTYIAELMNNTGTIYANEINKLRIPALANNIQRMGVTNCIVTQEDALKLEIKKVDRVLLDAPCSGTGTISKDKNVKNLQKIEFNRLVELQRKLILSGFDKLNRNGILVYSTCSVFVEENEWVVDYLLRTRKDAKIVDIPVNIGKDGITDYRGLHFHPSIKKCRRIYPHVHNMDGFFVAKIIKK